MSTIFKDTIDFLEDIRENNNRAWFATQKERYQVAQQNVKNFLSDLVTEMNKIDSIEKSKLFRIYRDVRFSKDKTPYSAHWSMSMGRTKPNLRGGYYLKLAPEGGLIACGFWNPSPSDMALIRANIDRDDASMRQVIGNSKLQSVFGPVEGETVKTAPKGYSKDHVAIDLIRHKQFIFTKEFSRKEVHAKNFQSNVVSAYEAVRPFFNYMSDILGHNLNGEPLY